MMVDELFLALGGTGVLALAIVYLNVKFGSKIPKLKRLSQDAKNVLSYMTLLNIPDDKKYIMDDISNFIVVVDAALEDGVITTEEFVDISRKAEELFMVAYKFITEFKE